MNWLQPWKATIRAQGRFNLLSADVFWTGAVCAAAILVFGWIGRAPEQGVSAELLGRAGVVVLLSYALAVVVYTITWLCPAAINSGPEGITRSRGKVIERFPWRAIRAFEVVGTAHGKALRLTLVGRPDEIDLLLPTDVDTAPILQEIDEQISKARGVEP